MALSGRGVVGGRLSKGKGEEEEVARNVKSSGGRAYLTISHLDETQGKTRTEHMNKESQLRAEHPDEFTCQRLSTNCCSLDLIQGVYDKSIKYFPPKERAGIVETLRKAREAAKDNSMGGPHATIIVTGTATEGRDVLLAAGYQPLVEFGSRYTSSDHGLILWFAHHPDKEPKKEVSPSRKGWTLANKLAQKAEEELSGTQLPSGELCFPVKKAA